MCLGHSMRRYTILLSAVATLAFAPVAGAATIFEINGGGDGHGIGMSQYGAYGYALHGMDYQFILAHYYQGTAIGSVDSNQTVRVLIGSGATRFSGASRAGSEAPSAKPARKLNPSATYSVRTLATGALALYNQSGKKVGSFIAPLLVSGPAPLNLAGHGAYRGSLEFRDVSGAVQTVNAVGLDDYVQGVVAAEMPASWAPAALEAQAVAARTYAITSNVGGDGYQLYSDTRSQMYGGVDAETPTTNAAVAATRGQILTYNGVPATTYFFSSSGGYTENIENVWLGATPEPWLKGVPDPYDGVAQNPYHRWSYQMTRAAAARALGSLVKGKFRGIRVTKRGVSPRVVDAEVVGSRGTSPVTGPQLQQLFALPSTYMRFTTVSSVTIHRPAPALDIRGHIHPAAFDAMDVAGPPTLTGFVFPAAKGSVVAIQLRKGKRWETVRRLRVGAAGSYSMTIATGRAYRVLYDGVAGPTVTGD
jgi:stage II sporulation protein D